MPTAILSDIHGNLPALEAVVADAGKRGCDRFVNLGDIVSGPLWPAGTAAFLIARDWPTIRGNHERQLLTSRPEQMIPSDRYAFAELSEVQLGWLRGLPTTLALSDDIYLAHGTPGSDVEYFLEHVETAGVRAATIDEVVARAGGRPERLIFCGHTHVPRVVELPDGRRIVNPGSVGLPAYSDDRPFAHSIENQTPHARYAMLADDDSIELIAVEYDHAAAAAQASRNGRLDWSHALLHGRVQ